MFARYVLVERFFKHLFLERSLVENDTAIFFINSFFPLAVLLLFVTRAKEEGLMVCVNKYVMLVKDIDLAWNLYPLRHIVDPLYSGSICRNEKMYLHFTSFLDARINQNSPSTAQVYVSQIL